MKKIALLLVLASLNAHAATWSDVNRALADKNWTLADLHIEQLLHKNLSSRATFNARLNQAWVKLNLGLTGEAKAILGQIDDIDYAPSELEAMTYHDTQLTVRYHHIDTLPPVEDRIIIDSSASHAGTSTYLYSSASAAAWTTKKVKDYLTVKSSATPFLKPIAPALVRGEFERPQDFILRVEEAQNQYKAAMQQFHESLKRKQQQQAEQAQLRKEFLPTISRLYTQAAIRRTIGAPVFSLGTYNATTEYFPARVGASRDTDLFKDIEIAIDQPLESAPQLKPLLRQAEPVLVFSFSDQEIHLTNVLIKLPDNRILEARVIDKAAEQQFATYQVPEISYAALSNPAEPEPGSSVVGKTEVLLKSLDPEIMRLKGELSSAEQADNQAAIARLRRDIRQFESSLQQSFDDDLSQLLARVKPVPEKPNYYAVVVGINKYARTINVEFADRSASLFSEALNKVLGVPRDNIILLLNEDATSGNIKTRLRHMGRRIGEQDRLFFFYAGHGIPAQNQNGAPFILAHDMGTGFASQDEDMKLSNVWRDLTASGQGEVIAFLDSCFSGNADKRWVYKGTAPGLLVREPIDRVTSDRLLIFSAGNEKQFANYYPEKGHRLFSYFLIKGLIEGKTSPDDLHQYVRTHVSSVSTRRGPDYEQTPQMKGRDIQEF